MFPTCNFYWISSCFILLFTHLMLHFIENWLKCFFMASFNFAFSILDIPWQYFVFLDFSSPQNIQVSHLPKLFFALSFLTNPLDHFQIWCMQAKLRIWSKKVRTKLKFVLCDLTSFVGESWIVMKNGKKTVNRDEKWGKN